MTRTVEEGKVRPLACRNLRETLRRGARRPPIAALQSEYVVHARC